MLIPDNFGRVGERQTLWELPFVRLIHLLAHHPDLDFDGDDVDPDILKMGAKSVFLVL